VPSYVIIQNTLKYTYHETSDNFTTQNNTRTVFWWEENYKDIRQLLEKMSSHTVTSNTSTLKIYVKALGSP
jgi:uncharacterized protein with PIN domain